MASSNMLKKVTQLKLQLTDTAKSTTILKTLQKLKDLDITLDILVETGIGKTVNSLRKHEQAGEFAKSLVRYWKKLVPKESTSNTDGDASHDMHSEAKLDDQNCPKSGSLTVDKPKSESLIKLENEIHISEKEQLQEEKGQENLKEIFPRQQADQNVLEKEHLDEKLENQEEENDSVTSKKNQCNINPGDNDSVLGNKNSEGNHQKSRPVSKEKSKSNSDAEKFGEDKQSNKKQQSTKSTLKLLVEESISTESNDKHSKTLFNFAIGKGNRTSEMLDSFETCSENKRQPVETKQACLKYKKGSENEGNPNTKNKKTKMKHEDKLCGKYLQEPSMSFESYLSYDMNASKKKERSGAKNPAKKFKTLQKERTKELGMKSLALSMMSENVIGNKKVKGSVMDLLNTPLPAYLPECDKPFSTDYFERKVEKISDLCDVPEETAVFTGQRLNKKMQVYSGAKTTFLPSMMSLYQQCIRILQNNIDLLYETGGVPFEILEPVLDRCTPDQLLRIEECNPVYVGVTDHLWGKHCQRDFRDSKLKEYESWKEMYIRLSEERERKLKRLTKSIVSAHSKRPKGRQVKMAFIHTVAKPPRDVRIQQEIHGTAGAIQQPHLVRSSVKVQDNRTRPGLEPTKSSTTNLGTSNAQDPRKKTRVAPMMAKSLKAFRNQLGRR
ncbi:elongin A, like [Polymixia lowei]